MVAEVNWLTDYEREYLGLASRRRAIIQRIENDVGAALTDKARLEKLSKSDETHLKRLSKQNSKLLKEQGRANEAVLNHPDLKHLAHILGDEFPQLESGFLLVDATITNPSWTGIGVIQNAQKTGAFIFGTDGPGDITRTNDYGVTSKFACQNTSQWRDEPTLKYAIWPRTFISGWVSAAADTPSIPGWINRATFTLWSQVTVYQFTREGIRTPDLAKSEVEELVKFEYTSPSGIPFFLDFEYGYLHSVPSFQLLIQDANVLCEIETKLTIECVCGDGSVSVSCGLYDTNRMPIPGYLGRLEIWARDFPIWAPSRDFG